jgi:hypothetical protein
MPLLFAVDVCDNVVVFYHFLNFRLNGFVLLREVKKRMQRRSK